MKFKSIQEKAEILEKILNKLAVDKQDKLLLDFMEDVNNEPTKTNSGFTKRMTGMLNSIKDALPTFEDDSQHGKNKSNS